MLRSGSAQKKKRWWRQKHPLPWWWVRVAWFLVALDLTVSAFFVVLYSLQWGAEKSNGWLSVFVLSFCQSLILVQPIKVRLGGHVMRLVQPEVAWSGHVVLSARDVVVTAARNH